jgi:thiamine-monophosphate kinase
MSTPQSEDDLIQSLFAPLTLGASGSFGLHDDVAFLSNRGAGIIVTQDQIIEGTHFLPDDPLDMIARRLVRRNLSDIIAKGAIPTAAFLSLAWPRGRPRSTMAEFVLGLGDDLNKLCAKCPLMGGDTSLTDGHLVASMTMIGRPCATSGQPVLRSGAKAGDVLAITGVIGDAYLGLQARLGLISPTSLEACIRFSAAPSPPRVEMAELIGRFARASLDVSDGLILDASRLGKASGVGISLDIGAIPLSDEAAAFVAQADEVPRLLLLATGGEDYQPLMAIGENDFGEFQSLSQQIGVRVTQVGRCLVGEGVTLTYQNRPIPMPPHTGWQI